MRRPAVFAIILLASIIVFADVDAAQAQWSALSSRYAVTTNWHGEDVPMGASVTAWAGTRDSAVKKVQFKWKDPDGRVAWDVTVNVFGPYVTPDVPLGAPPEIVDWANKHKGIRVWYACDTQIPLVAGEWGVQAIFRDTRNGRRGDCSGKIAVRATSFFVVPEASTVVAIASMLGALAFVTNRKKIFHP